MHDGGFVGSLLKQKFIRPAGIYLLSHSVGCLPADSESVLASRFYAPWRDKAGEAWPIWLNEAQQFRAAVALLLGGHDRSVCPQVNLSSAFAKILHGLTASASRRRILLCEEDFPSLGFVADAARHVGFEPAFIPAQLDVQDLSTWESALDNQTLLALVTHASSNRSVRLPVAEITRLCAQRGVVSVVDVAQSAGALPIDVTAWDADFVIGSCVKFLCGGPGAGFLWASDRALEQSRPLDVGWFSHSDPFEFDIHHFRYARDALRFWGGTPSILPLVQARHSIAALLDIGVDAINAHNQALISQLLESVPRARILSVFEQSRRGNTVLLQVTDLMAAQQTLRAASIFVDARLGAVRLAPHIYNESSEMAQVARLLQPFL